MKNVVNIDGLTTFTSPSFPESHSVQVRATKAKGGFVAELEKGG